MNKREISLFYLGGGIILATVVAFLYMVLLGKDMTGMQWVAALFLMIFGAAFMVIGGKR